MSPRRIAELESLRGLMALWVLLGHIYLTLPDPHLPLLGIVLARNGEAVRVFIVLSGFVIFNLLDNERASYREYITRRFFRLFPVYLVLLLVSAVMLETAITVFADPLWASPRNAGRVQIAIDSQAHLPEHLLAHLLLLQGIVPHRLLPNSEYAILGQAWSVSLEWQFYLVAPLCLATIARDPLRGGAIVMGCVTLLHLLLRHFAGEGFLPAAIPYFAVGCASYFIWKAQAGFALKPIALATVVLVGLSIMQGALAVALWCGVLGALMLERAGGEAPWPARLAAQALRLEPLQWLGSISYSLYLVHMIVLVMAMRLMPPSVATHGLGGAYLAVTVPLASLAAATACFQLIERPGMALGRRLAGPVRRQA